MLELRVCEIRGKCPVYKEGDKMTVHGAEILMEGTDAICIHALSTLLHYIVALDEGADPVKFGLSKNMLICSASTLVSPTPKAGRWSSIATG